MNEMSVFNGPEVTMHKSVVNLDGIEHREWHNLYGMYFQRATAEGLMLRDANKRPFVLSRSFYAGSQRWGAVWTGDNAAQWSHLKQAAPMLLSMSVCGLIFVGADAGGFFGDPDAELMARWIQAAAYTPFFRGHAHHDAKRREPWSFGEPTTSYIRRAIADRYALLPYWYSVFAESRFSGLPVMRPLWVAVWKSTSESGARSAARFDFYTGGRSFLLIVVRCSSTISGWSAPRYWSSPSRSKVHNMWTRIYRLAAGLKFTALRRSRTIRGVSVSGRRRRSRGPHRSTSAAARWCRDSGACAAPRSRWLRTRTS